MRARYYSPVLMRFINADILRGDLTDPVSLNRYAYANGNPVSYIDPFGASANLHTALDNEALSGSHIHFDQYHSLEDRASD